MSTKRMHFGRKFFEQMKQKLSCSATTTFVTWQEKNTAFDEKNAVPLSSTVEEALFFGVALQRLAQEK